MVVDRHLKLYGGRDPRELPAYSVADASVYLRVPPSTLAAWIGRKRYAVRGGSRRMPPLISPDRATGHLTWNNLIEGYVLASLTRTFKVPLSKVREALKRVGGERPLLTQVFHSDGGRIFIETATGELEDVTQHGQLAIREVVAARLKRVDLDDNDMPIRLYPWWKDPEEARVIALDPRRAFGRPTVVGSGVKIDVLVDRYLAGEDPKALSRDYDLPETSVNGVIRWSLGVAQAA